MKRRKSKEFYSRLPEDMQTFRMTSFIQNAFHTENTSLIRFLSRQFYSLTNFKQSILQSSPPSEIENIDHSDLIILREQNSE